MSEYSTRDRSKLFKSGLVDTPDIQDASITVDKLAPDVATYIDDLATDSISVANTGTTGQPQLSYDQNTGVISLSGSEIEAATKEPMGHADKDQSTITFNESTRTFTIAPVGASFDVWCSGVRYTFTSAHSIQIPNTTGIYYIYFNAGVLGYKTTFFTWEADAPTAYVYWNASTGTAPFFADERHGISLDWATHEYLHRTRGAAIASGFSASNYVLAGDGSSNTHAQIDLAGGTFFDEDLQVDIVHSNTPVANTWQQDLAGPAKIPMFYLNGTSWVRDTATDFPLKMSNSLPGYNAYNGSTWSVAEVADGKYATTWIIATNNLTYPIIALIGQSAADNAGQAEETQFSDLVLTGFPVVEFRPLYKLIFRVNSSYTNSVKASLASIWDLRQVSSTAPSSYIASDHGNLSGLGDDDHLQYVHISEARSISANHTFSGSVNFTGSVNLPNSGVTAGSYGSASQVPVITVNADGLVTAASVVNVAGVTDFDYNTSTGVLDIDTADGGNFSTTVTLQPFTTSNLAEGTNLYWTTARGESMFDTRLATKSTTNLAEGTNLYYTSARANTDFDTRLATKTTTDVAEGTNLYYTDARFDARLALKSTTDLAEGVNLYYTQARANFDFDNRLFLKTTDNLAEGMSNLYYTDARARAAISVDGGLLTYNTGSVGLSSETIQDVVGAMVSTNTETGIVVNYNDVGNVIDFAVDTTVIATKSYVDATVQAVIDSAPAALDTLNELAAAINDDANYAATVTTALTTKVDKTTQVIAGTGLSGGGALSTNVTLSHADTSSVANLTAGSRTYVTALSFDGFGHVTSYSTGTETVVDTNTTYGVSVVDGADAYSENIRLTASTGGTDDVIIAVGPVDSVYGLTISQASDKITISHANTSSVANLSSDNANGVVIQDVALTFDTYGHVTGASVATVDLDGRYYTETEADSRFVNVTGDTMTGNLIFGNATSPNTNYIQFGDNTGWQFRFMTSVSGTPTERFRFGDTGDFHSVSSLRSPIFYDSNSTGYYVDPAGATVSASLNGPIVMSSTAWTGEVVGKIQYHSTQWYLQSTSGFNFRNSGGSNTFYGDSSGNSFSTGSSRAPIFYDSDNTAAYANLAQTSGTIIATGASSDTLGYNASYGIYIGGINGRYIYSGNSSYTGPVFYDGSAARTVLTSGNYTSYRGSQLLSPNGATVVSGDAATAMPDAGHSFIHTLATGPGGNDGHILAMSWASTTSVYGAQLWLDTDPTNRMSLRSRSNAGAWNSWADVITSWSDDQVKTGYLQSNSSLRAPIFYDSNDTAYYIDGNNTSSLYRVNINNNILFTNYGRGMIGTYASTRYQAVFAMGDSYKLPDDGTTTGTLYGLAWSHPNAGGTAGNLNTHGLLVLENGGFLAAVSGSIRSRDDMRSPIFYDSNDTGWYIDPNSYSRIRQLTLTQARVDSSKYPVGHYAPGEEVFSIDPTWTQDQIREYFGSNSVSWVADSTAPAGYAISISGNLNVGGPLGSGFPYIPVETDDTFYMEVYIKDVSGTNTHYMGSVDFNESFSSLGGNPGSYGYWVMANNGPGTGWTKYSGYISGFGTATGTFKSGTKYWTPQALFNYTGGGTSYISGWKVYKLTKGIVGRFPNSTVNNGEAWYGRANDRNRGTYTIQLGGGSSSGRQFEVVDYAWSTVMFRVHSDNYSESAGSSRAPIFYNSTDTSYYWDPGASSAHRLQTPYGYLDLAPMNSSWCHFQTDRGQFYFGSRVHCDGGISAYDSNDYSYFPIYYDFNDTQYYCDPNGSTALFSNGTVVAGNQGFQSRYYASGRNRIWSFNNADAYGISYFQGAGGYAGSDSIGIHFGSAVADCNFIFRSNSDFIAKGNVTAYSDIRVKTNILKITDAIDKVSRLNGYTYDRIDNPDVGRQTGVIAQEVLQVLPEAVIGSEDTQYAVAYGNMVGLLIEAIKEQQTQIEDQKSEIAELKSMINMLVDKVNKLLD